MSTYQKIPTFDSTSNDSCASQGAGIEIPDDSIVRPPSYTQQQQVELQGSFENPISIDMTQTQTQTQPLIPPTRLITPRLASDGVFSNMSAKPESDSATTEETPPTYAVAMADQSPPYWQTTIMAPVLGDLILVEGLPTGHILHFFWNLIISATFQVFGFMLTYLLHTSHASKQGSRAGLGVSMIQYGFYLRSRGNIDDVLFDDTGNLVEDPAKEDAQEADIASCFLMILGWFLIIRSVADYTRAKRLERIIAADPTADSIV